MAERRDVSVRRVGSMKPPIVVLIIVIASTQVNVLLTPCRQRRRLANPLVVEARSAKVLKELTDVSV